MAPADAWADVEWGNKTYKLVRLLDLKDGKLKGLEEKGAKASATNFAELPPTREHPGVRLWLCLHWGEVDAKLSDLRGRYAHGSYESACAVLVDPSWFEV